MGVGMVLRAPMAAVALAALPADVMARVDEAAEIAQIEEEMAAIEAEEQQQG